MAIKNPKAKGGTFERKICKALSEWVSEGKDDNLFWRSALSGGRATVRSKKGQKTNNQEGDITAISPSGHWLTERFIIECKYYKDLEWSSFIYGSGFIWKTWGILMKQCIESEKAPMLIVKQNRQKELLLVDDSVLYTVNAIYATTALLIYNPLTISIYDFNDFISKVNFKLFSEIF